MRFLNPKAILLQVVLVATALYLVYLAIAPEVQPSRRLNVFFELFLLATACLLIALFVHAARLSSWARQLRAMEQFIAGMPDSEPVIPDEGSVEIKALARKLQAVSQQVRRLLEHANLEASRREAILACMAEGVLAVDADLKVTFCNAAFGRSFNARAELIEGRPLFELVREPGLREILEQAIRSGHTERQQLRFATAGDRTFEVRALPLGREAKQGAVLVLHDTTDIQHQEQVRKDFVADVSHELRTPLAAIRGYAETLLDGALDDPANSRRFVEIIESHAIRLGNIASDLLVLSDLDVNQAPLELQRVRVADVLESTANTVAVAAAERNVHLRFQNCPDCYVLGLRFRLEQALINLVDNAVKFNREHGEVVVNCECVGGEVRITVSDTGIGIPNSELKRIFERFYRVDKARSRPVGGTGLGLPIVKEVIERMGGSVSVESVLGRGSTFTIVLSEA